MRRVVHASTLQDVIKEPLKPVFVYRVAKDRWKKINGKWTLVKGKLGKFRARQLVKVPSYYQTFPVRSTCAFGRDVRVRTSDVPHDHIYAKTLCCAGFADAPYAASKSQPHMILAAARKRLLCRMPIGSGPTYEAFGNFVLKFLKAHFTPFPPFTREQRDANFDDWLSHYNKPLHRKEVLKKLRYPPGGGPPADLTERDFRCKSFIKKEFYEAPKVARFINSRSDNFKVQVAAMTHLMEKEIFYGPLSPWFVKGKPSSLQPSMIMGMAHFPHFFATDYTSFEAGFSPLVCQCAERAMEHFFLENNPEDLAIFDRVYEQGCYAREEILEGKDYRIKVTGTRMSGEMWTSLGNGFTNLMTFLFVAHSKGYYPDHFPLYPECPIAILIEGDDGLFGMRHADLSHADFEKLGWWIKIDHTTDISKTSFCSNYFSPKTLHQLVAPEAAIRVFYTFDAKYYNARISFQRGLLKAKAMSLLCSGPHSPITSYLARALLRLIPEKTDISDYTDFSLYELDQIELDLPHAFVDANTTLDDRLLYSELFGICVSEQLALEKYFESLQKLEEFNCTMFLSKLNNNCVFEGLGPGGGH